MATVNYQGKNFDAKILRKEWKFLQKKAIIQWSNKKYEVVESQIPYIPSLKPLETYKEGEKKGLMSFYGLYKSAQCTNYLRFGKVMVAQP